MAATTVAMPSNGSHSQNLRPELKRENIITASNQIERLKFDEKKESKDCRWSQHTHTHKESNRERQSPLETFLPFEKPHFYN